MKLFDELEGLEKVIEEKKEKIREEIREELGAKEENIKKKQPNKDTQETPIRT